MASMMLNEARVRGCVDTEPQYVVMCDGITHPIDILRSHAIPFADAADYATLSVERSMLSYLVYLAILSQTRSIEFQSWSKRFHVPSKNLLWKTYPNVHMLHMYGSKDITVDVNHISQELNAGCMGIMHVVKGARHGEVLFNPSMLQSTWPIITTWLNEHRYDNTVSDM